MDTQLFMECEEEELEPWQQVDDSVEEDDMDFTDNYCEPVEDSLSPLPASETPPPRTPPPITPAPTVSSPLRIVSSSVMSLTPSSITSTCSALSLPTSSKPMAPPLIAQAPPLFLTQTAGGTFLFPAASRTGSGQPILLAAQGFQVPTVVNPGAPLMLNLQPGQTVQPLTLIQSPALGQLVRPAVLSQGQTSKVSASSGGFTTMQLPTTTLTIRTGTPGPVNLQVTKLRSTDSLKLAACPASLTAPANGVTKATPLSSSTSRGHAPSVVTMAPASSPTRVVMSVEDFYYGRVSGDMSRRGPQTGSKTLPFTCTICSYQAENNLRLMQHMLQHSDLVAEDGTRLCCRFCYRQFSSSAHLKLHQDQVHGSALSSCLCRICEWAFENEPVFLNHMKSNHKPGEMPYVCQVCSYRSSFYSDVLKHFASLHRDSLFLLCIFCLKVTRNPDGYQQHLLRHKVNQGFHCNRCRLQFVVLKDKLQHKLENHRSFRRPAQLEGLPPGSKVTIRTYGKVKSPSESASMVQPNRIKTEPQKILVQKSSALHKSPKSPNKRSVSRRDLSSRSPSCEGGRLECLECGTDASDLSAHYPTYVHCLLCTYSSCCSRAYAAHMIHHHVPKSKDKVLPRHRPSPPSAFLLRCSDCDFQPQSADLMADHLLMNPEHDSAICSQRYYTEPDIQLFHTKEPQSSDEPLQNQDLPEQSWRSADNWKDPSEISVQAFTQPCGPYHSLSRNCDAIDFFSLIFPSTLIELITKETNAHAKTCHILGSGPVDWVPVTTHEIKGFIGLIILIGIHNLPDLLHYWSWKHYDNSYTFYRAMSFKRFQQISANICMGNFISSELGGAGTSNDPLHVFRPMLNILGGAMWTAYRPNCCLTIDRTLLPSLDQDSSTTKGNPKTQPQVWLLCDSKSGYCHRLFIQVGQKTGQDLGFSVVPELMKDLNNKNHQLFLANSLTSIPLMQKLLDQGVYASSSFPPPNPILPWELWDRGQLEKPGDFLQRQFGPLLATRWKDTKEMVCLSTNAAPGESDTVWRRSPTTAGGLVPINRPMAFRLLQENMRGVDICKQLLACNPLGGIPQDRHWRNLFWFLINLSVVNAFIVLRESRKENPPIWVQDGLFTQVNFRKRLGNQLAKCAQKYLETIELASSRESKPEPIEEPVKQRHRMAKITSISKRCKNCNLKNLRHESVYGCIVCKANLCKQPSCFWEFHSLSPLNKGSTKVGFLKNKISGAVEVDDVDNVDEAMAPVEDLDFSDDDKLDDLEDVEENETIKEETFCDLDSESQVQPETNDHMPTASQSSVSKEDFLSARQLRIILFALCEGLRQASRVFSTKAQLIRSWLKEARRHLTQTEQEQKVHAGGSEQMVAWVLFMREQHLPITESTLFSRASMLKKKGAFSESFRISYNWAVSFLLQHHLGVRSVGRDPTLTRILPSSLETKVRSFRDFTQKVFHVHQLTESSVAAMDELCLFVDVELVQDMSSRSEALEFIGSSPLITVYLTVLADGTMLPSLALTSRQLPEKVLPESVLLEVCPEGLCIEDNLELWTKKVWLQHLSGSAQPSKSMLVLDRHREHLGDQFLSLLSGSYCLPAVIPGGCSLCLQPLEVCLKPVLQRFLLSRWSKFTARNPPELEETEPAQLQTNVTQQLLDWVAEALTHLNKLPQVWKQSFHLTGLLPASRRVSEETEDKTKQKPEDIQADLLQTLTEILLGPESTETGSSELQELEDKDDTGDEQETSENQQDTKDEGMEVGETERETKDRKEVEGQEVMGTEDKDREGQDVEDHGGKTKEENLKDKKKGEMTVKDSEDRKDETETRQEDSEEEGKEIKDDRKDVSKERRETRIVVGKEVGDEWKLTVKTQTEGAVADEDEEDRRDNEDEDDRTDEN